jgi:putative DNA primase/helicase
VILSEEQATAVALWVIYSWLHEYEKFASHSPNLHVRSPERDSGKTTLLGAVGFLACRALASTQISGPALFRSIAKWRPTFIIDEADDVLKDNPELRRAGRAPCAATPTPSIPYRSRPLPQKQLG